MLLMVSFCLTKNECCTSDLATRSSFAIGSCYGACICCDDCRRRNNGNGNGDCNGNCDCNGGGGEGAIVCLIFVVVVLVFVAIFFIVKACGKHISRIFSVFILMVIELAIAAMAFTTDSDETYLILTFTFSLFAAICNFLGLLLPNFSCCKCLRYEYVINLIIPIRNQVLIDNPVSPVT